MPHRGEGSPPRRNVVLEDLDVVELRRREWRQGKKPLPPELVGTADDPKLYLRLIRYARPYTARMVGALLMSMFAAASKVGYFFAVEGLLQPIFEAGGRPAPQRLVSFLSGPSLATGADGVGTFSVGFGAVRDSAHWAWATLPPMSQLKAAATFLVMLVLLEQINKYNQKMMMRYVSVDLVRTLRVDLFRRLMTLSMRFFQRNHSGKLLSRITADLTRLGDLLIDMLVNMFSDVFTVIGSMIYVFANGGGFVFVALGLAGLTFVPIQQLSRRIRRKENAIHQKLSQVFQSLAESLANQKIVKAFTAEEHEIQRFKEVNDRVLLGRLKSAELRFRTEPVVEIVGALGVSLFLLWGGSKVVAGTWQGQSFFAVVLALTTVVSSLRRLADSSAKFQSGLSSADRVASLLYAEPEIIDRPDAVPLDDFRDCVRFEHVHYGYDAEHPVLHDVSFELKRGQTLAIVGHTGSGKSTIGDLVARFYDVDRGSVKIDGHDVRDVKVHDLRRMLAMVTQETVLFQGTIRSNIAYAMTDVSDEDVEAAARAAHAHEFITKLPQGYATPVGERGLSLSGGERQRIAIARALLSRAPILMLDEATSALDTRSERLVQDAIDLLRQDHTTFIIAHRLSTIRDADQILVLEQGRVAERGTHDELMAMGGIYARMVQIQSAERSTDDAVA